DSSTYPVPGHVYHRTAYSIRHAKVHTNLQEMFQMIKILIDMDFCIDVCGCNNQEATLEMPSDYYDYILGFGDMFRLAKERNPKAYAIIYMTENPYAISYVNEQERIVYFYERTRKKVPFTRTGKFYAEGDEELADAVICLGEKKYFKNKTVYRVYPSAFKNEKYVNNIQDDRRSTNFLVFGTKGFIHKGNDLLLEVFAKHPEWSLYLCGSRIAQECRKIGMALPQNVFDCGFVNVDSEKYLKLVRICPFVLLPSCSEGMSTALMTCMRHGLIPVTMRGTGMDELETYCEYFEGYLISQIEKKICELVSMNPMYITERSNQIYEYANQNFVLEEYTKNLKKALETIMRVKKEH
ncbi:MAG: glycosyltransferase, partial [Lachnospiraceae bacterium]|nr:glycosyltransferase [Lachnospiraceae bacterium]